MIEQELRNENERLRRELAEAAKSRERLREMVCALMPVDSPDVLEKQIQEMMKLPVHGIDDIIEELSRDERSSPQKSRPIPA
jgi:DNA repair exonuclease SbcCD ATPase subunit